MIVTRTSPLTGKLRHMDLDVTEDQLLRWSRGALVQDVFPHLTADQREFLMSGLTPEEFDRLEQMFAGEH